MERSDSALGILALVLVLLHVFSVVIMFSKIDIIRSICCDIEEQYGFYASIDDAVCRAIFMIDDKTLVMFISDNYLIMNYVVLDDPRELIYDECDFIISLDDPRCIDECYLFFETCLRQ